MESEGADFIIGVGYLIQLTEKRVVKKKHPIGFAPPPPPRPPIRKKTK